MQKEVNHSSCELRFLELEARCMNYEELKKKFECLSKQLSEVNIQFLIIIFVLFYILKLVFNKNFN